MTAWLTPEAGKAAGILIIPVGEIESEVLSHLCSALSAIFNRAIQPGARLPHPEYALNVKRRQYAAGEILARLPGSALGVTDLDLYVPQLNFVFGLADPVNQRAVIALRRLRQEFYGLPEDRELFLGRVVKEAVHELGHTCGLSHCPNRRCVMAFSNSLADTDYKGQAFCQRCSSKLK